MSKDLIKVEVDRNHYGPAVAALSEKHQLFVFGVCEGLSGSDAVRRAGYECTSAESYASRANTLHRRQDIIAALSEQVAKSMRALGPRAVRSVQEVLDMPVTLNPLAKLAAAKMVISRSDPEISRVDMNVRVEVIDHNKEAVEQLRTLQALKVPEVELVRLFGPNGLDRYRRMIAAADKAASTIDAEFTELPTDDDPELAALLGED